MAAKELIIPFDQFDIDHVVADIEQIRKFNQHRHEWEQLTAVCHEDAATNVIVGYKDLALDESWARGHMPGYPLMPGVLMCEAAAQLCSYYARRFGLLGGSMMAMGGIEDVYFRSEVRPGSRLVVVCRLMRLRPGILGVWQFQEFVDRVLVCEGKIKGVVLPPPQARRS